MILGGTGKHHLNGTDKMTEKDTQALITYMQVQQQIWFMLKRKESLITSIRDAKQEVENLKEQYKDVADEIRVLAKQRDASSWAGLRQGDML